VRLRPFLAVAVVAAAAVIVLPAGPAWSRVSVRLNPEVTVGDDELRLGDLGRVEGEAALARQVADVRLGVAPAPGQSYRLDLDHVVVRLRQHRIDPALVRLVGPERVTVTRAAQALGGQMLVDAASRPALERLTAVAPDGAPYALTPLNRPTDLRVPVGTLELVPRVQDPAPPYSVMLASVAVRVDGRDVQTVPVAFRVARLVTVVVATQALEPRAALSLADFRLEARPSTEVPPDALSAVTDPADLEAVRPIRAGEVVTPRHVRPRVVVRRGEAVTLVLGGQGFRITTQGLATADARRGDLLRVLNPTSRREVVGRVEAGGLVRVTP
jgi:flagella basal body P-ring formation protein FlgA